MYTQKTTNLLYDEMNVSCEKCNNGTVFTGCYGCCGNGVYLKCDFCLKMPFICDDCFQPLPTISLWTIPSQICDSCKATIEIINIEETREPEMCEAEPSDYVVTFKCNNIEFQETICEFQKNVIQKAVKSAVKPLGRSRLGEAAWSTLGKKGNDRQRYRKKVKIFFHVSFFGF